MRVPKGLRAILSNHMKYKPFDFLIRMIKRLILAIYSNSQINLQCPLWIAPVAYEH